MKLPKIAGIKPPTAVGVKSPTKTGSQQVSVKMPKPKMMPSAFDKPSLFFKSEDLKKPSIRKLNDFMGNRKSKK